MDSLLLQLDLSTGFGQKVAAGVGRYFTEHPDWRPHVRRVPMSWRPPASDAAEATAERPLVLVTLADAEHEEALTGWAHAAVNLAGHRRFERMPSVLGDDLLQGRVAAEHLLPFSLPRLAVVVRSPCPAYAAERSRGFRERIAAAGGGNVRELGVRLSRSGGEPPAALRDFLRRGVGRGHRVGLLAAEDSLASELVHWCRDEGIGIPEDVVLVSIGNNPFFTELGCPQISSVDNAAELRGQEAVALLRRLGRGEAAPAEPVRVRPRGVVVRESSGSAGVRDPHVAEALRFIQRHAAEPIRVDDVMEQLTCSRRTLESRFREVLGATIHETIWRAHVDHAQALMTGSDLTLLEVALRSGFSNASTFSTVFKRYAGVPPRVWRQRQRSAEAASPQ